jgi:uncharacterized protein YggE
MIMAKEIESQGKGTMLVVAALLLALGMVGSSYMLSMVDYSPKVNVSDITSTPNIYVSSTPAEHVISVSGTSSKKVAPDQLNIMISVETQDKNAKDSQGMNANVSDDLRAALKNAGVKDEEMKTTSYRVDVVQNSTRVCTDTYNCYYKYEIVGYKTVHSLSVTVTNLDIGGDIIDAAAGVSDNDVFVNSVYFSLQESTRRTLQKELLESAGDEAEEKAQAIAKGLGASLGKPVQASESFYYPSPYRVYDYAMAAAPMYEMDYKSTELSAGEVEVSATVNAGYELN